MEVNCFQILLIDVTFYLYMFKRWYIKCQLKNEKPNICDTGGKRVNVKCLLISEEILC